MAPEPIKPEKQQARSLWGTRLLLLLCAVFLGAAAGYAGVEYLISLRRPVSVLSAAPVRALPPAPEESPRMNVNEAGVQELQQARGIGPALAQAIVDYREKAGGFYYLEELMDVSGIGDERFASLRELFSCPEE
ncbi:MAG: helix-hairpin-helix domain-containing protein [Clostridiales bacterium]|nr:helix-hairpin-helix domain-containing protein [Clostridiales bacterium]